MAESSTDYILTGNFSMFFFSRPIPPERSEKSEKRAKNRPKIGIFDTKKTWKNFDLEYNQ